MVIRQATKQDYDKIYELVKVAFQTARVSDGKEQDFVLHLRASAGYVPEMELVAEQDGELVGHVMLTKQPVDTNREVRAVLVAPLCVKLEERSKKIGAALMEAALKLASQEGYTGAFLVGNPDYYGRFGFKQTTTFGISNVNGIPDFVVLGCELIPNSLSNLKGTINIA